ncbi:MAG: TraR/DksA family transcriptional regulator [Acidobacteriota bacterium]|nr:TraR/DksA family transcriptional regulator [Acidobacteriota bacterium]
MTGEQLEVYRRQLLDKAGELNSAIEREIAEVPEQDELATQDYGDRANSTYTKEALLQQRSHDSSQLIAVQDALHRIEAGSYGVCAECGEPIQPKRLDAVPWTPVCIQCQRFQDEMQSDGGAPSRAAL